MSSFILESAHKLLSGSSIPQEFAKYQLHDQNKWELKRLKGIISTR